MIRYLILGIVQGVTEFLPVSSSGHLVIAERLLQIDPPGVLFEGLLHLATLGAILLVFRRDLIAIARSLTPRGSIEGRKEIGLIAIGTAPIAVFGFLFRARIEAAFSSLVVVGTSLIATGTILALTAVVKRRGERSGVRSIDALIIGIAQSAALLPGLSRSGATIGSGILSGIKPERAARFSFLLAVPALFGAGLLSLTSVPSGEAVDWAGLAIAAVSAFVVGVISIRTLLMIVARGRFWVFSLYCLALGAFILARFG